MADKQPIPPPTAGDFARFMSRVRVSPSGCWEWTGGRFTQGYGHFPLAGKSRRAHRVMYVWTHGEYAGQLDHLCRNKLCVNPVHLEPVTDRVNVVERGTGLSAQNAAKTHCKRGHEFTSENTYLFHGQRHCRACRRDATRERMRAVRLVDPSIYRKPRH